MKTASPRWWHHRVYSRLGIGRHDCADHDRHLDEAAAWLARAQDVGADAGVPAFYNGARGRWAASYPETTGYIIPTLYDYAMRTHSEEFRERATRMAHWESDVQLANGAVCAGTIDAKRLVPTVFNTGQVLFGWAAAYDQTGEVRFADSLSKAADWLLSVQDADGAWRQFGSPFTTHPLNTYNTRTALGLLEAAKAIDEPRYAAAARANVAWALTQMRPNGWLENNDLEDNRRPLTHTIGYALQAMLEVGIRLGETQFIDAARHALARVAACQRRDGSLPGRLDSRWQAAAPWACLTGDVQIAYAWLQLARFDGDASWRESAHRAIGFVQSTQDLATMDPIRRGAIAGSYPWHGGYMGCRYPNWAAKFFMDAVMALREAD
ncbi:pectate lyase [Salinisphaera sp. SPP-AMP-43]|uniref:pectate lyase n=1 Tax=Salinisphaera sp. SPP-AMP-43 TaxID=3121288 RepID=UPI003C6DEEBB